MELGTEQNKCGQKVTEVHVKFTTGYTDIVVSSYRRLLPHELNKNVGKWN